MRPGGAGSPTCVNPAIPHTGGNPSRQTHRLDKPARLLAIIQLLGKHRVPGRRRIQLLQRQQAFAQIAAG